MPYLWCNSIQSQFFHQLLTNIIPNLLANILTPALSHLDATSLIINALQHCIYVSGIEIITRSYRTGRS